MDRTEYAGEGSEEHIFRGVRRSRKDHEMMTDRCSTKDGETAGTVKVRNLILGDGIPKICVPVAAKTREQLDAELLRLHDRCGLFDMVEFRADMYSPEDSPAQRELPRTLEKVREAAGDKPVLFTFRTKEEGGRRTISFEEYRNLNLAAAESGADLADLQLELIRSAGDAGRRLQKELQQKGVKVIGSFHDFKGTPSADEMVKKMVSMQMMGLDITKIAVMPRDREDVLELLFASVRMREDWADRPYITMSMGDTGRVSRVCGTFSGSCITFGTIGASSAPGQISASSLRTILPVLL